MGFFSALFGGSRAERATTRSARNPATGEIVRGSARETVTIDSPVEIQYENFRGELKTFTADKYSVRKKKEHISAVVAPHGVRIALKKSKIQNIGALQDVLSLLDKAPSGKEARIMKFHHRRGTTSAQNDELRARFPEWVAYTLK